MFVAAFHVGLANGLVEPPRDRRRRSNRPDGVPPSFLHVLDWNVLPGDVAVHGLLIERVAKFHHDIIDSVRKFRVATSVRSYSYSCLFPWISPIITMLCDSNARNTAAVASCGLGSTCAALAAFCERLHISIVCRSKTFYLQPSLLQAGDFGLHTIQGQTCQDIESAAIPPAKHDTNRTLWHIDAARQFAFRVIDHYLSRG